MEIESAAHHGFACIVNEKRKRMRKYGGAVGNGRSKSGRNQRVHLEKDKPKTGDKVKGKHTTFLVIITCWTVCTKKVGMLDHVSTKLFKRFSTIPRDPKSTIIMVQHPEVLWAQRSSQFESEKVHSIHLNASTSPNPFSRTLSMSL